MITLDTKFNTYKYKPTFQGQRLFPVTLLKIVDKKNKYNIPAYFTKLNSEDLPLMHEICSIWEPSRYGEIICKGYFRKEHGYRFAQNYEYFMIETNAATNKESTVKAIGEVVPEGQKLILNFLQSKSEIEKKEIIKGGAKMFFYGLCKYAKQIKAKSIEWFSDNEQTDKLYKKLGFEEVTKSHFILRAKNYNKFEKSIEKEFF